MGHNYFPELYLLNPSIPFYYFKTNTSIAAVPVTTQEAPFIFNLRTADHQVVKVQGQISFRVTEPEKLAEMLNFSLKKGAIEYSSEDPLKLSDRVVQSALTIVQDEVQKTNLKNVFKVNALLATLLKDNLTKDATIATMGLEVLSTMVANISADTETTRALEADARESILKEADDAIYARRKAAVEQELMVKEAELQTELTVQKKEQEIAESGLENERTIFREKAKTDAEQIQANIEKEQQRKELVALQSGNRKHEADAEAYAVKTKMEAFKALPVENLKAMALANMSPDQLMAVAFEALANNAGKIGELTITPDLFSQAIKRAKR